ncbi:MAG: YHS domain-containing protein, partial [Verrucomicrobiales bacterium]
NVGFCCKKCKAKFDKDPDKHIAKVETDSAEKK